MRIRVTEGGGKNFRLYLPNGLVLNRLSATVLSAGLKNQNIEISGKQLHILFRAIKEYKAAHPEWKIVEVCDRDGEIVEIAV